MAAEWYYAANQQRVGPVELQALQQMLQAGTLSAGDNVYGPGLTEWTRAGQVPALQIRTAGIVPASQVDPLQMGAAGMLAYRGVEAGDAGLSERAVNLLRQTKPWTRFVSVMMFIGAGLMVAGGAVTAVAAIAMRSRGVGIPPILGVIYLAMGALYIAPAIYLHRFSNAIARLMRTRGSVELEDALAGQKSFWKFIGIMIIAVIALYIMLIIAIVFKMIPF